MHARRLPLRENQLQCKSEAPLGNVIKGAQAINYNAPASPLHKGAAGQRCNPGMELRDVPRLMIPQLRSTSPQWVKMFSVIERFSLMRKSLPERFFFFFLNVLLIREFHGIEQKWGPSFTSFACFLLEELHQVLEVGPLWCHNAHWQQCCADQNVVFYSCKTISCFLELFFSPNCSLYIRYWFFFLL